MLGTTKRIAERIVLELPSLRTSVTDFRVVRFGNVLGSDGSVVPLFKRQLDAGGPLTVTHPDVTRYFMTIPEAVQLVLQSAALPECAGRIALLEMGTPMRIVDLAEQLIRLAGLTPGKDIQIVFTGLRPGEKLAEELLAPGEQALTTTIDKIRVVEPGGSDGAILAQRLRHLLQLMARHDERGLIRAPRDARPRPPAPRARNAAPPRHRARRRQRQRDMSVPSPHTPPMATAMGMAAATATGMAMAMATATAPALVSCAAPAMAMGTATERRLRGVA